MAEIGSTPQIAISVYASANKRTLVGGPSTLATRPIWMQERGTVLDLELGSKTIINIHLQNEELELVVVRNNSDEAYDTLMASRDLIIILIDLSDCKSIINRQGDKYA